MSKTLGKMVSSESGPLTFSSAQLNVPPGYSDKRETLTKTKEYNVFTDPNLLRNYVRELKSRIINFFYLFKR